MTAPPQPRPATSGREGGVVEAADMITELYGMDAVSAAETALTVAERVGNEPLVAHWREVITLLGQQATYNFS